MDIYRYFCSQNIKKIIIKHVTVVDRPPLPVHFSCYWIPVSINWGSVPYYNFPIEPKLR